MLSRRIKWIVEAALAAVGVLGAHNLAAAPEAWLNILAEYPWIAGVLTFGGGVGVTLAVQDLQRSGLPHRTVDLLADWLWSARQFFHGTVQSGHVRAYHLAGPDGEEPPDPVCITTRAGVRFKRPWRSTLPAEADQFWVATTFVTAGVDGVLSVLPPAKRKAWGAVYGGWNDLHRDRRATDRYMRYRLPDGHFSPQVHLGGARVQGWKELCSFHVPEGSSEQVFPAHVEPIDLDAVSEFLITFTRLEAGENRPLPGATFGRVDELQTLPASGEDPNKERMLYCQLAESGSSAAIGMPAYGFPRGRSGINFGLTFRQSSDSGKDSVTDALLFYCPGGTHHPAGRVSVDWR